MLEGITVLSESNTVVPDCGWFTLIGFVLAVISLVWFMLIYDDAEIMVSVFIIFWGLIIWGATWLDGDSETRYKVTISEEVSMVEFCEKYEVIDVDGMIYTIKEKAGE